MLESLHAEINSHSLQVNLFELHPSGGGAGTWNELSGKPFERIGDTLAVNDGTLDVNIHEVHNDSGGLTTIIG